MKKNDVILVYPDKRWFGATEVMYPPLALMPLAGELEKEGYKARIVDLKTFDYKKMNLSKTILVGISSMTSRQISYGLEAANFIKEKEPEIPIVWGGIHASLLPEQTVEDKRIDVVAIGEGEKTIVELTKAFEKGKKLNKIKGIAFKEKGKTIITEKRPFLNLDEINDLCYHLIENFKEYTPQKKFFYPSSRGCPHRCTFCYNTKFCNNTWRAKSTKKILEDVKWIVDEFKPKTIDFNEDNFFVNKQRVYDISKGFIEEEYDFEWAGDCRVDYFSRFDREFLETIKKAGCNTVFFGCESGSTRTLKRVKKDITVEQTIESIKKCKEYDIKPILSFVVGFPFETKEDILKTMRLIDKLDLLNEDILATIISTFTPYPGTPLFEEAIEAGYIPPKSLEEWGQSFLFGNVQNTPWLKGELRELVDFITTSSRLRKIRLNLKETPIKDFPKVLFRHFFVLSARARWKHRFTKLPIEWKLWELIQRQRGYA